MKCWIDARRGSLGSRQSSIWVAEKLATVVSNLFSAPSSLTTHKSRLNPALWAAKGDPFVRLGFCPLTYSTLTPEKGEIIHFYAVNRWDEEDEFDKYTAC